MDAEPAMPSGRGSVSAGGAIGIASTGDFAVNVQVGHGVVVPAEALQPVDTLAAPAGLVHLPVRPGVFVGRADVLAWLDAAMQGVGRVVVQAVHGLGGIGKSTHDVQGS
jgi:hypothetical protein